MLVGGYDDLNLPKQEEILNRLIFYLFIFIFASNKITIAINVGVNIK